MALDGGGGGGGPVGVGNSFTGAAQALEIYGDFGAAYSGQILTNDNVTTHLEFRTGNFILVGSWRGDYFTNTTQDVQWKCYFNDSEIQTMSVDKVSAAASVPVNIVIPSYTIVKITAQNITDSTGILMGTNMTGRIYR
jgi:hypothetical protein